MAVRGRRVSVGSVLKGQWQIGALRVALLSSPEECASRDGHAGYILRTRINQGVLHRVVALARGLVGSDLVSGGLAVESLLALLEIFLETHIDDKSC